MRAVVPLYKLETFTDLLEESIFRHTDRCHMSDMVPLVIAQEEQDMNVEIKGSVSCVRRYH